MQDHVKQNVLTSSFPAGHLLFPNSRIENAHAISTHKGKFIYCQKPEVFVAVLMKSEQIWSK